MLRPKSSKRDSGRSCAQGGPIGARNSRHGTAPASQSGASPAASLFHEDPSDRPSPRSRDAARRGRARADRRVGQRARQRPVRVPSRDHLAAAIEIDPKKLLGKKVTFSISSKDNEALVQRHLQPLHAGRRHVARLQHLSPRGRPEHWLLTQRHDCRIFQNKSCPTSSSRCCRTTGGVTDFSDQPAGFLSRRANTACSTARRDFDFVSRLMEEEGIFYFFKHDARQAHAGRWPTASAFAACPRCEGRDRLRRISAGADGPVDAVNAWEHRAVPAGKKWRRPTTTSRRRRTEPARRRSSTLLKREDQSARSSTTPATTWTRRRGDDARQAPHRRGGGATRGRGRRQLLLLHRRRQVHARGARPRASRTGYVLPAMQHRATTTQLPVERAATSRPVHQPFACIPTLGAVPPAAHDAASPSSTGRRRPSSSGRRRGDLHRQVRPRQGAVLLGPRGQEGREQLVLDPRRARAGPASTGA